MKLQPFSKRDQSHIIQTVNRGELWKGIRGGRLIEIRKRRLLIGPAMQADVYIHRQRHSMEAGTVAELLEQLNHRLQFDAWAEEASA